MCEVVGLEYLISYLNIMVNNFILIKEVFFNFFFLEFQ